MLYRGVRRQDRRRLDQSRRRLTVFAQDRKRHDDPNLYCLLHVLPTSLTICCYILCSLPTRSLFPIYMEGSGRPRQRSAGCATQRSETAGPVRVRGGELLCFIARLSTGGGTAPFLRSPPSQARRSLHLPYRPLQSARYWIWAPIGRSRSPHAREVSHLFLTLRQFCAAKADCGAALRDFGKMC